MGRQRSLLLFIVALITLSTITLAVKQEDFKQCSQSSFCRRLRAIGTKESESSGTFASPYSLGTPISTPDVSGASWTWPVKSALYPEIAFNLRIDILAGDGIARIRVDEVGSKTEFRRYNETAKWALVDPEPPLNSTSGIKFNPTKWRTIISYGSNLSIKVDHSPLKITQYRDGQPQVIINERSLFHMEHFRIKDVEAQEAVHSDVEQMVMKGDEMDRSWFETSDTEAFVENWKRWKDTKPKGPEGLSLDITFPNVQHVYGLPEHASPLSLPDTIGPSAKYSEPYRLFNVDIFEYLADSPMALYGAIPLLHAHSAATSVGVLNLVGSETWVDVLHDKSNVHTHWMSESGILDLLLLPGPRPQQLFEQMALLTGPTPLPPQWSTAYHQCRWNYIDEADVLEVDRRFDEVDIPLDVTWLDIEYAEEHKYFEWDKRHFPDPNRMLQKVEDKGRKMVAIVDPHIKNSNFRIANDAKRLDILIKSSDGTDFTGFCWTGNSIWVDFFNPKSMAWWTEMFTFKVWTDSAKNLFIWNDMNEPSVFDGPEITVPKDVLHFGGWENRDVHNINGMLFHKATSDALIAREDPERRPFVLSRSFYAGSQRYGAIWTGDNMGTWDHLAGETAMILSNNIGGMSFCGADVGGFFGNPSEEMLVRWYQAGAFMPFFRAHAHEDTRRREPFLYDEPIRGYIRDVIRLRYQMLPLWYNAFHDASLTGVPIIKPQYVVFPGDAAGSGIDDQYYIGDSGLLFKPVVKEGATTSEVYLSDDQPYYDYFSHHLHPASPKPRTLSLDTPLSSYPLLLQGGHIIPTRQRVRRASPLMWQDPFTLTIALSKDGTASGQLYLDDGVSYGYTKGEYIWRHFDFAPAPSGGFALTSTDRATRQSEAGLANGVTPYAESNIWAKSIAHVNIERIIILGLKAQPKVIVAGVQVQSTWTAGTVSTSKKEGRASELVIKNPGVGAVGGWEVVLS